MCHVLFWKTCFHQSKRKKLNGNFGMDVSALALETTVGESVKPKFHLSTAPSPSHLLTVSGFNTLDLALHFVSGTSGFNISLDNSL